MEPLDAEDLTLHLAFQHVKSLGLKELRNQIFKFGLKAGLDLESVHCQTTVQDVVHTYNNIERESETQAINEYTNQMVYDYLNRANYTEEADEFAKICRIQKCTKLSETLEGIVENENISQHSSCDKLRTWKRKGLVAGVDFCDTDAVKFSNANSRGGGITMTYKEIQYSFQRYLKNDLSYWQCRRNIKLKCKGYVHFCSKTSKIVKEMPHNDQDHSDRLIPSTLGTNDTSIRYSKSLKKTPVLHFCGYEYTKYRTTVDGRVRWQCRVFRKKECKGYVYTKDGQIHGQVREHSHLPADLPPIEKSKNDRMLSSLFI